ncbi:MAG TPA: response regulator [Acidimicrobiales bacterium]|nr:response regulator [Acidimicrobiales bacterium]
MGGRVLVVDDEAEIRELCRVNLEFEGFDVVEAKNGSEAIELARRVRPDLVFLDLMMPGVDGWDVLHALKTDDDLASIPVILLTAKSGEEDQMRGWQEGILEYVSKPFNPLSLAEWARRAMVPRDPVDDQQRRQRVLEQLRLLRELRETS